MSEPVGNLLEDELRVRLLQLALPLDEPQQIPATGVFHHHEEMLARLEDLEEPDDVGVLDLLEEVDLLEHLALAEVVLHVCLLDGLDGDLLPS